MSSDWAWALDNLAASGVIDFDAPAYILDRKPRYVGNPSRESLPMTSMSYLPENVKLKDVPELDSYQNSKDGSLVKNPGWKKWAFAGAILAAITGAAMLLTGKKLPKIDFSKIKMPDLNKVKDFGKNILNYIKTGYSNVLNKFKKP